MNLGFNRGDDHETVFNNYRKMTAALGIGVSNLVLPKQTHSLNVKKVTKADCGNGIERANAFEDVDVFPLTFVMLFAFYNICWSAVFSIITRVILNKSLNLE